MISAYPFFRLGWLMQEFLPHVLVNHGVGLTELVELGKRGTASRDPSAAIEEQLRPSLKRNLDALRAECTKLQLIASFASLSRMLEVVENPNGTYRELGEDAAELQTRLIDELKYRMYFALHGRELELFSVNRPFGNAVADHFPDVQVDLEEAAKCLALDRATACVFHLMRVLDHGLQQLAADLKITRNLQRSWHLLLQDVETAIAALPRNTDPEKAALGKRSAAAAHLRNVKDAWRNDTMHPRATYTVEQAHDIWNHTKALMNSLAAFL